MSTFLFFPPEKTSASIFPLTANVDVYTTEKIKVCAKDV